MTNESNVTALPPVDPTADTDTKSLDRGRILKWAGITAAALGGFIVAKVLCSCDADEDDVDLDDDVDTDV